VAEGEEDGDTDDEVEGEEEVDADDICNNTDYDADVEAEEGVLTAEDTRKAASTSTSTMPTTRHRRKKV
jgi:hypothetical protein